MLQQLHIQNYALIEHIEIDFVSGFSVVTGETGAGKSIILGALGLLLGQRADSKSIKEGCDKCIIEAVFDISDYPLSNFFEENELDYQNNCIIRREIHANGKSRSFVNDTPIGVNQLKELGAKLIDVHSQHENLLLSNPQFQLNIVDTVAQNSELLKNYQQVFNEYKKLKNELSELLATAEKSASDKDYLQFQYTQLNDARLQSDEQTALEEELKILSHSEEIKTNLSQIVSHINKDEQGVLSLLKECVQSMRKTVSFLPAEKELEERLSACYIEIKDLVQEVENKENTIEYSPEKLEFIQQRLDLIYTLQKKHKVSTVEELLRLQNEFATQLSRIDSFDEDIAALKKKIEAKECEVEKLANELSEKRKQAIPKIIEQITKQLQELGMPQVQFDIVLNDKSEWTVSGRDDAQFLFSSSKHISPKPVSQIASGGEISRLMLGLKSLIANMGGLPTIIFDEIDTGVSGEIADKMASIMQQMSQAMQVISITHLPQIAAKGDQHYKVFKKHDTDSTATHITQLSAAERIQEIAQMLSGAMLTDAAILNAKELLA